MNALVEKRNNLANEVQNILNKAKAENRAVSADEMKRAEEIKDEVKRIDATLALENEPIDFVPVEDVKGEDKDVKAFANFIRTNVVNANLTKGDNGAVIPATIANKIIDKVKDICPIYALASKYNVKGTFSIPYVDTSVDDITVAYADEFAELTGHSNKFAAISLTGYTYGALTLVSKSLVNNSDFDLVAFVINRIAEKVAQFLENELLNGTEDKASGIAGSVAADMKVTLAAKSTITADELIDIQELVRDQFQANSIWIMNRATRKAIRKLKDKDDEYLLNRDVSAKWGYTLLGKPVYVSDNITALGTASALAVVYGDMSGLAVKEVEQAEAQVLVEKYATQHAVGVVAWGEFDAKIENAQKIAVGICGAADA